jgi:hypothetical protein
MPVPRCETLLSAWSETPEHRDTFLAATDMA